MKIRFRNVIFYCISLCFIVPAMDSCRSSRTNEKDREMAIQDSIRILDSMISLFGTEGYDSLAGEEGIVDDEYAYPYRPSRTNHIDILHTRIEISFDTVKRQGLGKATIRLRPYFYPTDSVVLDAKQFNINKVSLVEKKGNKDLVYTYDSLQLTIRLGKTYKSTDTLTLFIDYTAKPEELRNKQTGEAITDNKGLYFINPDGKIKDKPFQIWTQGETEANSCWFPTVDAPNEKMTQEILVTVPDRYVTLSNGLLIKKTKNSDGTRTDHWKQSKPHSVYLAMLVVGNFAVVKDKWRNLEVSYYVEPEYAPYARLVFGNTPEMMEFFSKKMGVDYPWEKFSQIVVRDFVSGAMENTSAVTHFEKLQHDAREHLDETYEDIISHELFHHWFGDLVTAESWANLPLNESFATYGEYMWREYKYGTLDAEMHRMENMQQYLDEAAASPRKLVRYHYDNPDDMFDRHSYQKGGLVLHMLRKYTGDEAFFKALNLYLTRKSYKTAEIHDLRMAFEEVTGEDLNWFFNQWFFTKEPPAFVIEHYYDVSDKTYTVRYTQNSNEIFDVPLKVVLWYADGRKQVMPVRVKEQVAVFTFPVEEQPLWADADGEDVLLCRPAETKNYEDWLNQYKTCTTYFDKVYALDKLFEDIEGHEETVANALLADINNPFWKFRQDAIKHIVNINGLDADKRSLIKEKLIHAALYDNKAAVRVEAVEALDFFREDAALKEVCLKAFNDSSYLVSAYALALLAEIDSSAALEKATAAVHSKNKILATTSLSILAEYGDGDYSDLFEKMFKEGNPEIQYNLILNLGLYLERRSVPTDIKLRLMPLLVEAKTEAKDYIAFLLAESAGQNIRKTATAQLDLYKKGKGNITEIEKLEKLMEILDTYFPEQKER